ncbi:flotillin domain-containing protein [Tuber borchii]|uniref:Flotillin domain-containing protein n=1 Tax=Tuber borchii TaxID=42251 RepID=A0A2T7A935_TUBBO|nr:flotillin domain-containing protein [Tuber borchii]
MWYHVSEPNSYLAITGVNIDTVRIAKKAFVKPLQKVTKFSITPFDFSLQLQAMTIEKLQFALPAVFTIGPEDTPDALQKYASLLTGQAGDVNSQSNSSGRGHVQDIVKGIIEGETRVIVSGMSMDEIFKERKMFKEKVIANVQGELSQFGLKIYNANVKELHDTPGSEYFAFLSRKAHEGALNQAKIDVAEARMRGEIGEKEKQGLTAQHISKIEADTAIKETERKKDKATAEASFSVRQQELNMEVQQATIKAKRAAEARDAELSKDVEKKRAEMELERLRAVDVVKSVIARETQEQKADAAAYTTKKTQTASDAKLYQQQKSTDAAQYETQKSADARQYSTVKAAEADYLARVKKAEADLITAEKAAQATFVTRKREAEGMLEMAKAYQALSQVMGGPEGLMQFLMIERGVYGDLANANAKAIQGLQPKISVWNTGSAGGEGAMGDPTAPLRNIFQALPPLFSTINDQTGISPPAWMAQMPNGAPSTAVTSRAPNGQAVIPKKA